MTPEMLREIKTFIERCKRHESIGLSPGTWLPALVEEIERLTAENERIKAELAEMRRGHLTHSTKEPQ